MTHNFFAQCLSIDIPQKCCRILFSQLVLQPKLCSLVAEGQQEAKRLPEKETTNKIIFVLVHVLPTVKTNLNFLFIYYLFIFFFFGGGEEEGSGWGGCLTWGF